MTNLTIRDLSQEAGWIRIVYPDNSVRLIYTTQNREILGPEVLRDQKPNSVYDLEKKRWVTLPSVELDPKVYVTREKPVLEELDEFANRFI